MAGDPMAGAVTPDRARHATRLDRRGMAEEIRHLMAMPRPFDGFSNTPSTFPRLASSTWSAIATGCRSSSKCPLGILYASRTSTHSSPTARCACGSIPTGSSSSLRGRRSASIKGSLLAPMIARAGPSMTGAIIWPWSSASLVPYAMALPWRRCHRPFGPCSSTCLSDQAVTARWWRSSPWSSSRTSRS